LKQVVHDAKDDTLDRGRPIENDRILLYDAVQWQRLQIHHLIGITILYVGGSPSEQLNAVKIGVLRGWYLMHAPRGAVT
jgi:hypothetical protein